MANAEFIIVDVLRQFSKFQSTGYFDQSEEGIGCAQNHPPSVVAREQKITPRDISYVRESAVDLISTRESATILPGMSYPRENVVFLHVALFTGLFVTLR